MLIFFGYPQAHEDDAERAVRAALQLVAAVADLKTHAPLQTRVGIATGLVVVGEMSDAGGLRERGIVGETPNLAARLQSSAEPNQVVIADNTRRLLGNIFELKDLGSKHLKGMAEGIRAWAVLQASSVASRFEAMHATRLTDLVGREEELGLLLRRWARAKAGEGQVVLLSGEPGIGKSRLTAALLEHIGREPYTRLRYFCSPHHADSALYPIIGHLNAWQGLHIATACKQSSTSWTGYCSGFRGLEGRRRSHAEICRCRTTGAIRACSSRPSSADKGRWKRSGHKWRFSPGKLPS